MPAWPTEVPAPQWDGMQIEMQDTVLRSSMDTGPGKTRRRFTAGSSYLTLTWALSCTQLYRLADWWAEELLAGSLAFDWVHPLTGATVQARFRKPPSVKPMGQQTLVVRLSSGRPAINSFIKVNAEPPVGTLIQRLEGLWQFSGELEVLP